MTADDYSDPYEKTKSAGIGYYMIIKDSIVYFPSFLLLTDLKNNFIKW